MTGGSAAGSTAGPDDRPNLVVTGFMATGKSAVGRLAAAQLELDFVDLDALLEARLGAPIPVIFQTRGEPFFRDAEAALAREVAARRATVIATGGGTMLRPESRAVLGASGVVVCLWASPETIARRVLGTGHRPLLSTAPQLASLDTQAELAERARRLIEARRPIYELFPLRIDTDQLPVEAVAARAVALYRRHTIGVVTALESRVEHASEPSVWQLQAPLLAAAPPTTPVAGPGGRRPTGCQEPRPQPPTAPVLGTAVPATDRPTAPHARELGEATEVGPGGASSVRGAEGPRRASHDEVAAEGVGRASSAAAREGADRSPVQGEEEAP